MPRKSLISKLTGVSSRVAGKRHNRSRLRYERPVSFESLELRTLLTVSVTWDLTNGIQITDNSSAHVPSNDTIKLSLDTSPTPNVIVSAGGTNYTIPLAATSRSIHVYAGFGDDYIQVDESNGRAFRDFGVGQTPVFPISLNGGHGADTILADVSPVGITGEDTQRWLDADYDGNPLTPFTIDTDPTHYLDQIRGSDGDDIIDGVLGNDRIFGGRGNDWISGGDHGDFIDAGEGDDIVDAGEVTYGGEANYLFGGPGNDTMFGSRNRPDNATGPRARDELHGGDGNDIIRGFAGPDALLGEHGCDTLYSVDDAAFVDQEPDLVLGGSGQDVLYVNKSYTGSVNEEVLPAEVDMYDGGSGKDIIYETITGVGGVPVIGPLVDDPDQAEPCDYTADLVNTNNDTGCAGEQCQSGNGNTHPNRTLDEECDCDAGKSYSTSERSTRVQGGTQQGDVDVAPGSAGNSNAKMPQQSTAERPHPILLVEAEVMAGVVPNSADDNLLKPKRAKATLYLYDRDARPEAATQFVELKYAELITTTSKWFKFGPTGNERGEPGDMMQLSFQIDADSLQTGRYDYKVHVEYYNESDNRNTDLLAERDVFGSRVIVNRKDSKFGTGWWLPELDQLYLSRWGVALVRGDNTAAWFEKTKYQGPEGTFTVKPEDYITPDGSFYPLHRNGSADNKPVGSFTLKTADGGRKEFGASGILTASFDRHGNQTSYVWSGSTLTVTDPYMRVTTYTFSGNQLTSITDFAGRITNFEYDTVARDASGTPISGYAVSDVSRILYPALAGGLRAETKFVWRYGVSSLNGSSTTQVASMDMKQRVNSDSNEANWINTRAEFDAYGRVQTLRRSTGKAWTNRWSLTPRVVYGLSAVGTSYANAALFVASEGAVAVYVDEFNRTYEYKTDRFGLLTEVKDPLGGVTRYVRDLHESLGSGIQDKMGMHGLLTSTILPDPDLANPNDGGPIVTKYQYMTGAGFPAGQPVAPFRSGVTLPDGRTESYSFDTTTGQLNSFTDEFGRKTTYAINAAAGTVDNERHLYYNTPTQTFALFTNDWDFTYTSATVEPTVPRGLPDTVTHKGYDFVDRTTSYNYYDQTEHAAGQAMTPKRWRRGLLKELLRQPLNGEPTPVKLLFDYDNYGNLSSVTDELGRVTVLEYDALDRLVRVTSPDPDGNPNTVDQPIKEIEYDLLNRVTKVRLKNFDPVEGVYWHETAYEYLQDGRDVKITESARQNGGGSVVSHVFLDPVGKVTSIQDPLNRTTLYAYDELQRLKEIQEPDPGAGRPTTTYEYDRMSRLTKLIAPATPSNTAPTAYAPAVTINAVQGAVETVVNLSGYLTDAEDPTSALRFEVVANTNPGIFDAVTIPQDGTARLVLNHGYQQYGTANITVRATDTRGQSAAKQFTINVDQPATTTDNRLNQTTTSDDQYPVVAPLADGGFVVAWINGSNVYARRFDARGYSVTGDLAVTTSARAGSNPGISRLFNSTGQHAGFVVTWEGNEATTRVYAQRYDINNAAVGGVITVDDSASIADRMPVPVGLVQGGFIVAWRRSDAGTAGNQVVFQRFLANGQKFFADGSTSGVQEVVVNVTQNGSQGWPAIAALPDGGWVITWDGQGVFNPYGTLDPEGIFARRYDRFGAPVTGEMPANATLPGSHTASEVAADGTFVVTWRVDVGSDTSQVFVRKFGADGTPVSPELLANTTSTGVQNIPDVALTANGGFVVVWYGQGAPDTTGIYMRRYDRDAKPIDASEVLVNSTTAGTQAFANVALLSDGRLLFVWHSNHSPSVGYDIYGKFLTSDTAFTPSGPFRVTSISPGQTVLGGVNQVQLNFSAPINSTNLVTKITVKDPTGAVVSGTNVNQISQTGWLVTFPSKTMTGVYSIAIATTLTSATGQALSEAYNGTFTIADSGSHAPGARPETTFQYDVRGRQTQITDALGNKTNYEYYRQDAQPDPSVSEWVPKAEEWVIALEDVAQIGGGAPVRRRSEQRFDKSGRLYKIVEPAIPNPDGAGTVEPAWTFSYETGYGINLSMIQDPRFSNTEFVYDGRDQLVKKYESTPDTSGGSGRGALTEFGYDVAGNLTKVTEPSRKSFSNPNGISALAPPITEYRYDGLGRLQAVFEPNAATGQATDGNGNPVGPATYFTYDMVGNLLEKKEPDLGTPWGTPITSYEYDRHFNLEKITEPDPDGTGIGYPLTRPVTQYAFDDLDRRTSMTDPLGRVTAYQYDALDRISVLIGEDPDGDGPVPRPYSYFKYDGLGNLVAFTDALGRVSLTGYDLLSRTIYSVDAIGGVGASAYDKASRITSSIDELGRVTTYGYDDLDRVTSIVLANPGYATAPEHKYLYDQVGNLRKYTDARAYETAYTYDRLQRLTKLEQPEPTSGAGKPTTSYLYDAANRLIDITDPLNRHTSYDYDYRGQQTHAVQANPSSGIAIDRPAFNPWTVQGPLTLRQFDALGRNTQVTAPDPGANYDSPITNFAFDAIGRLTGILEPDPLIAGQSRPQTLNTYDPAGQLDTVTNAVGVVTDYDYDGLGRRSQVTVGGTQVTKYSYDLVGNQTSVVAPDPDGSGSLGSPITVDVYNRINRLVSQQDPRNGLTRYTYDAVGNVTSLTDPLDNVTSYEYDVLDRQTREINPLFKTRKSEYDKSGNLTRQIDRRGWVRQFAYDALNRNTEEKWFWSVAEANAGTPVVRDMDYTLDKANQLTAVTDANGSGANASATYGFDYDKLGRVIQSRTDLVAVTGQIKLDLTYDLLSRRESLKATIGSIKDLQNDYVYDGLSRLKELKQHSQSGGNVVADKRVDFRYDSLGRFTTVTRYNDVNNANSATEVVTSTYGYNDSLKRLTDLTHKHGTTTIDDFDWAYDKLDRVTTFTSSADGVSAYQYDATGQLIFADHTSASIPDESYVNDLGGNRRQSGTGAPIAWTTDSNNRLVGGPAGNYVYDDEGNRVARLQGDGSHVDYLYDHRNRLVRVTDVNVTDVPTKIVEYSYDAFDRRTRRTVDLGANGTLDTAENFVYDGDDVLLDIKDLDGAASGLPTVDKRYLHGPAVDQILAEESGAGVVRWYLGDNLGTTRDLVNNSGALMSGGHYQYDAYGNVKSGDTALTRYLYTAREFDRETSLQYNRARWYDSATGRWISEDPIGFAAGDTNLSRYAGNSTTNFFDASGKAPLSSGSLLDGSSGSSPFAGASPGDVMNPNAGIPYSDPGMPDGNVLDASTTFEPMSPFSPEEMLTGPTGAIPDFEDPLTVAERDALPRELGWQGAMMQAQLQRLHRELFDTIRMVDGTIAQVKACECGDINPAYTDSFRRNLAKVEAQEARIRADIARYEDQFASLKILWETLRLGNRVSIRASDSGTFFETFIEGDDIFNPDSLPRYAFHGRKWDSINGFDMGMELLGAGIAGRLGRLSRLRRLEGVGKCATRGSSGHRYALEVLEGGTGRAFAGHGEFRVGSGHIFVPEGTTITLPRDGMRILDRTAGYLERGDWDALAELARIDPRVAEDLRGMATHLPGARVPNYTLKSPLGLRIYDASDTVDDAANLSELLTPNSGNRVWAACTELRQ